LGPINTNQINEARKRSTTWYSAARKRQRRQRAKLKKQGQKDKKEEKQKGLWTKWWRRGCLEMKEKLSHRGMICVMHRDQSVNRKRTEELEEAWMGTHNKDKCTIELQGIQVDC
jgi:hypothetical protein